MPGRPRGIPHIVQAIEKRHEIIILAGKRFGRRDLERNAIAHALASGGGPS